MKKSKIIKITAVVVLAILPVAHILSALPLKWLDFNSIESVKYHILMCLSMIYLPVCSFAIGCLINKKAVSIAAEASVLASYFSVYFIIFGGLSAAFVNTAKKVTEAYGRIIFPLEADGAGFGFKYPLGLFALSVLLYLTGFFIKRGSIKRKTSKR